MHEEKRIFTGAEHAHATIAPMDFSYQEGDRPSEMRQIPKSGPGVAPPPSSSWIQPPAGQLQAPLAMDREDFAQMSAEGSKS